MNGSIIPFISSFFKGAVVCLPIKTRTGTAEAKIGAKWRSVSKTILSDPIDSWFTNQRKLCYNGHCYWLPPQGPQ